MSEEPKQGLYDVVLELKIYREHQGLSACKKYGLSPKTCLKAAEWASEPYTEQNHVGKFRANHARLYELARQGQSIGEIARAVGVSKQRVHQLLLKERLLYEEWKGIRESLLENTFKARSAKRHVFQEFASVLRNVVLKKMEDVSWAYKKAIECSLKQNKYSFPQLLKFFSVYDRLKQRNKLLTTRQFAYKLRFSADDAVRILRMAGLRPFRCYKQLPEHLGRLYGRVATKTGLSFSDVAHFAGTTKGRINYWATKRWAREIRLEKRLCIIEKGKRLTYRFASEIYRAKDLGYSVAETAKVLGTTIPVVKYALHNREDLEKRIIGALKMLYPYNKISTPYVPVSNRSEQGVSQQ